jgi:hypothetical protein
MANVWMVWGIQTLRCSSVPHDAHRHRCGMLRAGSTRDCDHQPETATEGWFADPFERHHRRYWGGSHRTDRVSDKGIEITDPPGQRPSENQLLIGRHPVLYRAFGAALVSLSVFNIIHHGRSTTGLLVGSVIYGVFVLTLAFNSKARWSDRKTGAAPK